MNSAAAASRLIPAGAGNTRVASGLAAGRNGSSPRVRGTQVLAPILRDPLRLIPAGAGNTRVSRQTHPGRQAHPRGCGEHTSYPRLLSCLSSKQHQSPLWTNFDYTPVLRGRGFSFSSPTSIFTPFRCIAPARFHTAAPALSISRPPHQGDAIEIDRFPMMVMRFEGIPLLVPCLIHQQGTSRTSQLAHLCPESLSNTPAQLPDENSRRDLQHPLRQMPP